jgi:hypothetical protein
MDEDEFLPKKKISPPNCSSHALHMASNSQVLQGRVNGDRLRAVHIQHEPVLNKAHPSTAYSVEDLHPYIGPWNEKRIKARLATAASAVTVNDIIPMPLRVGVGWSFEDPAGRRPSDQEDETTLSSTWVPPDPSDVSRTITVFPETYDVESRTQSLDHAIASLKALQIGRPSIFREKL